MCNTWFPSLQKFPGIKQIHCHLKIKKLKMLSQTYKKCVHSLLIRGKKTPTLSVWSQKSLDGKRHGDVENLPEAVATGGKARHVLISGARQEQRGLAGDKTSIQNRWDRKFERWMATRSLQKLKCQSNDFLLHWEAAGQFSFCFLFSSKKKKMLQNITAEESFNLASAAQLYDLGGFIISLSFSPIVSKCGR